MNSPEHRAASKERWKGNKLGELNKGIPKSEEHKAKFRASWTPERREAARQRMLGNKRGPGRKKGHVLSEESRLLISKSRIGKIFREDGLAYDDPRVSRARKLKYRYHVDPAWYEEQLSLQEGHCALCPATEGYNGRLLSVDHDHKCCGPLKVSAGKEQRLCGKCLRGLLCDDCNNMLGKLERSGLDWAERAIAYLKRFDR